MFSIFPSNGERENAVPVKARIKFWFKVHVRPFFNPRYAWGWLWNLPWQPKNYVMRDMQTPSERRRVVFVHEIVCKERAEAHETLDKLYEETLKDYEKIYAAERERLAKAETQERLNNICEDLK